MLPLLNTQSYVSPSIIEHSLCINEEKHHSYSSYLVAHYHLTFSRQRTALLILRSVLVYQSFLLFHFTSIQFNSVELRARV